MQDNQPYQQTAPRQDANMIQNPASDSAIDFKAIYHIIVGKWYWFVVCIAVALGIGALYLAKTPKVYTRRATLLIKDDSGSGSGSASSGTLSSLSLIQSKVNLENEIGMLRSPILMRDVVNRLSINNFYTYKSGLRSVDLYKKSPVVVIADDPDNSHPFSFNMIIEKNGDITISDIVVGDTPSDKEIRTRIGSAVKLPGGMTVTLVRPKWNADEYYGKRISFRHTDGKTLAASISKSLSTKTLANQATAIVIRIPETSIQRGDDILNTLIQVYNEHWLEDRNQVSISTSRFIDERLAIIQQELGNVDSDISSFKSANLVPNVEQASTMFMEQSAASRQNIFDITNQISMAKMIRAELVKGSIDMILPATSGIDSQSIQSLMDEYNMQVLERNRMLATSSDRNPVVTDMTNSLRSLRANITRSLDTYIATLNTQLRSAERQQTSNTSHLAASPGQAKYLLSVERQQKVKEALYLFLLQKREENELGQAFTAYNSSVIEEPTASPEDPAEPETTRIMTIAFFTGFLIPFAFFYCRFAFDNKVRTKRDLAPLSAPYLGEIPLTCSETGLAGLRNKGLSLLHKHKNRSLEQHDIYVTRGSRDAVNEAFRVLRTNLEFILDSDPSSAEKTQKIMAITSANPGSGKTFVALNLAKVLAIKDQRVLLIDLDLRRGSLSRYLGKPKTGITDYIVGKASADQIIIRGIDGEKDFDAIAVGAVPPNPAELLASKRLQELIEREKDNYDYILLDCPPAEVVTDALIINRMADRTIFVMRAGLFDKELLHEVERFYQTGRYRNITLLLNGTEIYGGYGYARYGYRYGNGSNTYGND